MIYYSPTGGFYSSKLHGGYIPDDAIEITESKYHELLSEQGLGKSIKAGPDGLPVAVEPPGPTAEQIMSKERAWRDAELKKVDIIINTMEDSGGSEGTKPWRLYRVALRDWPESQDFPNPDKRPVSPE